MSSVCTRLLFRIVWMTEEGVVRKKLDVGHRVEWVGAGVVNPVLGRSLLWFDEQSRQYGARGVLFDPGTPLVSRYWDRPQAYNQLRTSQCVAFSTKGICNTDPMRVGKDPSVLAAIDPKRIYDLAQTLDPWPGTAYNGTSTLAGMKAAHQLGLIPGYRWCFGVDDVLKTLSQFGPVAVGVTWWQSMFQPGYQGMLVVDKSGGNAGGHCVELHGIDVEEQAVHGTNSWGQSWGDNGTFKIRFEDLDMLLRENGEAVTVDVDMNLNKGD